MSYHPACSDFIDPETAEIARFGLTSLRASGAIFFWVDGPIGMADVELEGVNKQFFRDYASSMVNLDPLHVNKMRLGQQSVAQLTAAQASADDQARYANFLNAYKIVDVVDLLFWSGGHPVAGLGLFKLWGDPPVCGDTMATANALQRFVEHNLFRHRRVAGGRLRNILVEKYRLTARESEVSELAMQGRTNAEIAGLLDVSLATVKTHLLRVLAKAECANRTQLAAKFSGVQASAST
jgi:DNA-binding CsgD family transcriptional regulator